MDLIEQNQADTIEVQRSGNGLLVRGSQASVAAFIDEMTQATARAAGDASHVVVKPGMLPAAFSDCWRRTASTSSSPTVAEPSWPSSRRFRRRTASFAASSSEAKSSPAISTGNRLT